MSRDSCQLCREITHCQPDHCQPDHSPRYKAKRLPEISPGAVFMGVKNRFRNISVANDLLGTDLATDWERTDHDRSGVRDGTLRPGLHQASPARGNNCPVRLGNTQP